MTEEENLREYAVEVSTWPAWRCILEQWKQYVQDGKVEGRHFATVPESVKRRALKAGEILP